MGNFKLGSELIARKEKLNFAVAVALVCLLYGAIISSLLVGVLKFVDCIGSMSLIDSLGAIILMMFSTFSYAIVTIPLLAFVFTIFVGIMIYCLDIISIRATAKLTTLIFVGIGLILAIFYVANKIFYKLNMEQSILYLIPYILVFSFYTLRRNIWRAETN